MLISKKRTIRDYFTLTSKECTPSIVALEIEAENFEISVALINLVPRETHSVESLNPDEDPNLPISMFLQLCNTLKDKGVSKDAIQLRLFPFSVKGKARKWLKAQRLSNITT